LVIQQYLGPIYVGLPTLYCIYNSVFLRLVLYSLWSFPHCITHTMGIDKLTIYINDPLNNHAQCLSKLTTAPPLGKSGIIYLSLIIP
jgi:hypothetical protein